MRLGPAALLSILSAALASACAPPAPDLVLLNGRVFTADPSRPWVEALAIRGDRVVAAGDTAEVTAMAGPATVRRDVGGRTVIPGLNDAHVVDRGDAAPGIVRFLRQAVGAGVTSMQWFAGGRPVSETAAALLAAAPQVRIRVFRMPRPGPGGETIDSRPHLPPQPSFRLDIRGMGFRLGAADEDRIRQAAGWAYGTEDLLALEPADPDALAIYLDAVEHTGVPEVWRRKRPRVEQAGPPAAAAAARMAAVGMVAVQRPGGTRPLASLVASGVVLALGTGEGTDPFAALAWATSSERGAEALTMPQAVTAFTRGSAHAEFSDRDKGHLVVGALADLAVLSGDPFAVSAAGPAPIRSVLTIIGGLVVHDVP